MENKETDYLKMLEVLEQDKIQMEQKLALMTEEERIEFLQKQNDIAIKHAKEYGIKTLKISGRKNG